MAKLTLTDIASGYNSYSTYNANNSLIEAALENTLSLDGTSPNALQANLDMNSNRIVNLPNASNATEPVTLGQAASIQSFTGVVATAGSIGAVLYAQTSGEVSAGVTPTNYQYPPGNVLRYGNNTTPGTTDMTAAIQAALDSSYDVYFPAGTYSINDRLDTGLAGQYIHGDGEASIIFLADGTDLYTTYAAESTRTGMLNIYHSGVIVENLRFDQNFRGSGAVFASTNTAVQGPASDADTTTSQAACILLGDRTTPADIERVTVQNCTIWDYFGDAICVVQPVVGGVNAHKVNIVNNTIISAYIVNGWSAGGVSGEQAINVGSGQDDWLVDGNKIYGALDDSIATHNNCERIVISNNIITTTGGRIICNGSKWVTIQGNTIYYIQDGASGISLRRESANVAQEFCKVIDNNIHVLTGVTISNGILCQGQGSNLQVSGNTITFADSQPASTKGIWITYDATENLGESRVSVTNNHIDNAEIGIRVSGNGGTPDLLTDIRVAENHLHRCGTGVVVVGFSSTTYLPVLGNNHYFNSVTENWTSSGYWIDRRLFKTVRFVHGVTYTGTAASNGHMADDANFVLYSFPHDVKLLGYRAILQDATGAGPDNSIDAIIKTAADATLLSIRWAASDAPAKEDLNQQVDVTAGTQIKLVLDGVGSITTAVGAIVDVYYIEE